MNSLGTRTYYCLAALAIICSYGGCVFASMSEGKEGAGHMTAELNSNLSDLVKRLQLVESAGMTPATGQYFVRIFALPLGEECDAGGKLCEGMDALISVASPDLFGDHALYRLTGLADWKFEKWDSYAEVDSPDHFTAFVVKVKTKPGVILGECANARSSATVVTLRVNPWKMSCEYKE